MDECAEIMHKTSFAAELCENWGRSEGRMARKPCPASNEPAIRS